jgi:hypothetical protein
MSNLKNKINYLAKNNFCTRNFCFVSYARSRQFRQARSAVDELPAVVVKDEVQPFPVLAHKAIRIGDADLRIRPGCGFDCTSGKGKTND